jgi:Metallo-beta-lactamase superfamily
MAPRCASCRNGGPLFYRFLITAGLIDEQLAEGVVELILRGFAPRPNPRIGRRRRDENPRNPDRDRRDHDEVARGLGPWPAPARDTLLDREWTEPLPIYAFAIEHPEGVIVVDTGETARASQPGYFAGWHPGVRAFREWVEPEQEIGPQLGRLGIRPSDVRWLVMTHLHTDHAGRLHHFPRSSPSSRTRSCFRDGTWQFRPCTAPPENRASPAPRIRWSAS